MKWLLIYEFDVEIYRQAPTVRIFLDKILLNEFSLQKKTLQALEIEYDASNESTIEIEFVNDDNNYTNGFMTKGTYIYPKKFFLLPKCLVENYYAIRAHYETVFSKSSYYIYRNIAAKNPVLPIIEKESKKGINKFSKRLKIFLDKEFEENPEYIKFWYKDRTIYPENFFYNGTFFRSISFNSPPYSDIPGTIDKNLYQKTLIDGARYGKSEKFLYKLHKKHGLLFKNKKKLGFLRVIYDVPFFEKSFFEKIAEKI